jgi:hypothetical protein
MSEDFTESDMTTAKTVFPLATVLSAYHNRLLVSFGELRGLLDWCTGCEVPLWEIPRARALVAEHLAKQYPWLAHIQPPEGFKNDAMGTGRFVKQVVGMTGLDRLEVYALPRGSYKTLPYSHV